MTNNTLKPNEQLVINSNLEDFANMISEAFESTLKKQNKLLLTQKETAEFLGISESTLKSLRSMGKIPAPITICRRNLWSKEELIAWVNAGCPNKYDWEDLTA